MAKKKVVILNESQLAGIVKDITLKYLNEMDGATYARAHMEAKKRFRRVEQNEKDMNQELPQKSSDDMTAHGIELEQCAANSMLSSYKNTRFMFYANSRLGIPVHLLFSVENIKKITDGLAILSGMVIFGLEQLPGDITIDFNQNKVSYRYKGNQCRYILEPDIRTLPIWQQLCNGLRELLSHSN